MFFFFFGVPQPNDITQIQSEIDLLNKKSAALESQLKELNEELSSNALSIDQLEKQKRFLYSVFNPEIQGNIFISESKRPDKESIKRYYCRFTIAWPDWPIPGTNSKLKPFKYTVSIARVDNDNFSGIDDSKLKELAMTKIKKRITKETGIKFR